MFKIVLNNYGKTWANNVEAAVEYLILAPKMLSSPTFYFKVPVTDRNLLIDQNGPNSSTETFLKTSAGRIFFQQQMHRFAFD